MRKGLIAVLAIVALLGLSAQAWAVEEFSPHGPQGKESILGSADHPWNTSNINTLTATTVTVRTSISAPSTWNMPLPLNGFMLHDTGGSDPTPVTSYSINTYAPGYVYRDGIACIVWASDASVSAMAATVLQQSFRLPAIYSSGLAFRVFCSSGSWDATTPNQIDWAVLVNNNDASFIQASVAQTAVSLATATGNPAGTNEVVTLTVNNAGLVGAAAGSLITLDIWNSTGNEGSGDLEIKAVEAYATVDL